MSSALKNRKAFIRANQIAAILSPVSENLNHNVTCSLGGTTLTAFVRLASTQSAKVSHLKKASALL